MASIGAKSFDIRSSLDLPADAYEATVATTDVWRDAIPGDTIKLEAGLIDPATGTPKRVGHLEGPVDGYGIRVAPNGLTCTIRGRDAMAEALERQYECRYLLEQPTAEEREAMTGRTFAGAPDPLAYQVGTFLASEIATDIAEACGLMLSWECRDYRLWEDFEASGRAIDTLKRLVEPWSQVPMFQVDVLVQADVLICRARAGTFVPDYTFSVRDARVKNLDIDRAPRQTYVGRLALHGKLAPKGLTGGGVTVVQSSEVEETSLSETKDASGAVIGRVSKTTVYRMPDRIVLRVWEKISDLQNGALKPVKESYQENEWEASRYNASGPINQPKQLGQMTITSGIHPNDKQKRFRELSKEEISYAYDDQGFQDAAKTRKWEINLAKGDLEERERVYRTLRDVTQLETEEVTTIERPAKGGEWYVYKTETVKSAGLRPGGRKPGRTITVGQGDAGPMEPIALEARLSTDPWAKDHSYANPHLTEADLRFIRDQFVAWSGMWEYTLKVQCVTMPWIKKGKVLQLTGLADHAGNPIALQPALITENVLTYDESSESPSMTSQITAVYWADS